MFDVSLNILINWAHALCADFTHCFTSQAKNIPEWSISCLRKLRQSEETKTFKSRKWYKRLFNYSSHKYLTEIP